MTNPTAEAYKIYKSRKGYLKKLYQDIINMDLMSEKNKIDILEAITNELQRVQDKINDLQW